MSSLAENVGKIISAHRQIRAVNRINTVFVIDASVVYRKNELKGRPCMPVVLPSLYINVEFIPG